MSTNVPQTRLPSYKSSTLRQQSSNLSSTYQSKSPSKANPTTQTKLPTPTKPSPIKEYKSEIEKLKKEISTIKAENSILKAKVRRVDDENIQKGRQIEKMRAEIKALQKNESANSRKSKESHELLLLRQKCLRLENALKEKDIAIKKLNFESSVSKADSEKLKLSKMQKIYQVTSDVQVKNTTKSSEKETISAKSSLSRASLSLKTEVTKLRDMIHKLEKENQDLQQQAKQHCQEVRRLKIQLKSKDKITPPHTSTSKSSNAEVFKNAKNKSILTATNNQENLQTKMTVLNSPVPKPKPVKRTKSPLQPAQKISPPLKSNLQKSIPTRDKNCSIPNGKSKHVTSNNQVKGGKSKLPVTKPGSMHVGKKVVPNRIVTKSATKNSDLERKVQEMRENIAAKKIQRSWRQHQKDLQHTNEFAFRNGGKALTFIISSMKHHRLRKDKLNILVKRSNTPDNMKKESFVEVIESISKKVWGQDFTSS